MTTDQEFIFASRFGYGIRPDEDNQSGDPLAQLRGADPADRAFEFPNTDARRDMLLEFRQTARDQGNDSDAYKAQRAAFQTLVSQDFQRLLMRPLLNPRGFRERLFAFWLDHFTVVPQQLNARVLLGAYFEDAIRPNILGRFSDLLKAVITHPSMLLFLDQNASVGPNSRRGKRSVRGLNENLAREVLELHTLGVNGGYTQNDVQQFAELLTGLTVTQRGSEFLPNLAEPGAETIFGIEYGGRNERLENIYEFLEDLTLKPATAQHLAKKLAVHFMGPHHDDDMVNDMARAFRNSGGQLMALYDVLLEHPSASGPLGQKARTPFEYMIACMRAVNISGAFIQNLNQRDLRRGFNNPLTAMGQKPFEPSGPDGWDEAQESWITPPTLAARINWAGKLAQDYADAVDPRDLLATVVGPSASDDLTFAVRAAEAKWEGVALLLISPEFMRR